MDAFSLHKNSSAVDIGNNVKEVIESAPKIPIQIIQDIPPPVPPRRRRKLRPRRPAPPPPVAIILPRP
ncbi:hypothetical protein QE152_g10174 [Popillia japonica]|uniref:Uncharacterized protein n=1 Tax=Popillia japonica TaxID=7064 RepID=A0AAW1LW72_POPJA